MVSDTSLAVLIDAHNNSSVKHAQAIFDEIVKLGGSNVRHIYGDFFRVEPSARPVQQVVPRPRQGADSGAFRTLLFGAPLHSTSTARLNETMLVCT